MDNAYLDSYEATKNDSELIALIFKEQQNDRVYSVELDEMDVVLRAKCKNVANKMQKIGFKKRHFKRLLNAK